MIAMIAPHTRANDPRSAAARTDSACVPATAGYVAACALAAGLALGAPWYPAAAQQPAAATAAPKAAPVPKSKTAAATKPTETAAAANPGEARALAATGQSIAVLVNDEPITGYEINQRQRMLGLSADIKDRATNAFKSLLQQPSTSEKLKGMLNEIIQANKGKTKEQIIAIFEERKKQFALSLQKQAVDSARASVLPGLRKAALEELIDERLKMQEARRLNVLASEEDANRLVKSIAERNKMTDAQFAQHLKGMGADVGTMRDRFRATLSWNDVIRRRFGQQIAITERDVDRIVSASAVGEDDTTELQVHRITLPVPAKLAQKVVAQRLQDAETMRRKFGGCKTSQQVAAGVADARFEDLGTRKASSIGEPTRSLLLNAKDGEMLPPSVAAGGVELWAVCSRNVIKADVEKRTAAQEQLRQKELEALAKRHLKDLRQDAHIEYR